MSKKSDLGKIAAGALIGVGVGILLAPKSGKETRQELKIKMDELLEKAKELKAKGIKNEFDKKIKALEREIKELDKEKVLKIAKEKASSIKEKADDLVKSAIERGSEALEVAAKEVRKKALEVSKSVVEKLENTK